MYKNVVKYILLAVALWAPSKTAASRLVLPLTPGPQATLADIFASGFGDKKAFHFPNTPHFRHWYDFTAPRQYSAFYNSKAGSITLGGFVRFIENGKRLFKDIVDRARYEAAMASAVKAHKDYQARPSTTRYVALHAAEAEVLTRLAHVPLTNQINQELCSILSTPDSSFFSRFLSQFILPFRAHFVKNANDPSAGIISRGSLLLELPSYVWGTFTLGLLLSPPWGVTLLLFAYVSTAAISTYIKMDPFKTGIKMHNFANSELYPKFWLTNLYAIRGINFIFSQMHNLVYFTNYKLAPEPKGGVTVIIQDDKKNASYTDLIDPQNLPISEEIKPPLTLKS